MGRDTVVPDFFLLAWYVCNCRFIFNLIEFLWLFFPYDMGLEREVYYVPLASPPCCFLKFQLSTFNCCVKIVIFSISLEKDGYQTKYSTLYSLFPLMHQYIFMICFLVKSWNSLVCGLFPPFLFFFLDIILPVKSNPGILLALDKNSMRPQSINLLYTKSKN